MDAYKNFMDRQSVSARVHAEILSLTPDKARKSPWRGYAALAAGLALLVAVGAFAAMRFGPASDRPTADVPPDTSGGEVELPGIAPGASGPAAPELSLTGDREAFLAEGPAVDEPPLVGYPAIWGVDYAEGAQEAQLSLALPDGAFSVPLKKEDILRVFWGPEGRPEEANTGDFPLFLSDWAGYLIYADATYDGNGDLWELKVWGEKGGASFFLRAAPGRIPPTCCIVSGAEVTTVVETDVSAWHGVYDRDGDGAVESVSACEFLAGDVGVRFENVGPGATQAEVDEALRFNTMFVNHACRLDGHLYLGHLLRNENIPDWYSENFDTLAAARACEGFFRDHPDHPGYAAYLPAEAPAGFGEFFGHISYQQGTTDSLFVHWSRGYAGVEVTVQRPMGMSAVYAERALVDVGVPESYDWRLYDGPIWDSVPAEYRESFYCPTFRAEDMSLEVVQARMNSRDTGGAGCLFTVLHPNGVAVRYACSEVSAEYVWSLVEATL